MKDVSDDHDISDEQYFQLVEDINQVSFHFFLGIE